MRIRFQPSFDEDAYRKAKGNKGLGNKNVSTQSKSSKRPPATPALKTTSPELGTDSNDEFPPIKELLRKPMEIVDLTKEPETPTSQQESTIQQHSPKNGSGDHGRHIHEPNMEPRRLDLTQQSSLPKEYNESETGTSMIEYSGNCQVKHPINFTVCHNPDSLVDQSKNPSSSLKEVASHTTSTRQGTSGNGADVTAPIGRAFSEQAQESEAYNAPGHGGQAPTRNDSVGTDRDACSGLRTDGGQVDNTSTDEWDAEIIGEESGEYLVAWKPTFISKEDASTELINAWEAKKARMGVQKGKKKHGSGAKKQAADVKGVAKTGSAGAKRGKGRPRKA
ncbi:hypothetical protein DL764_005712 [Monosporascus ibericus]|uniref:Chromo domain-containing protein n=1 Tax=Monosporascus ibericus TaxID=155417 RepID=A0A4Q4TB55_9PEZI|nr:hypothetical protein DL764_005712 [Monosporascus ibericus]